MSFEDVETFLSVVEHRTIAEAATSLYIGQGTASMRLARLEQELGTPLVFRQRGMREITLTPEGETFLPIARELVGLWQQARELKDAKLFRELRIAALDNFNRFLFVPVYQSFLKKHPDVRLYLQTEHATEIHQLIENQQIDVGFTYNLHRYANVVSSPLFTERMGYLYHVDSAFGRTGDEADLPRDREIYQPWSREFAIWHSKRLGDPSACFLTLGTASMLPTFIEQPDTWTITTPFLAKQLTQANDALAWQPIEQDPPPTRTAHILLYRHPKPWVHELAQLFLADVYETVRATPELELAEL